MNIRTLSLDVLILFAIAHPAGMADTFFGAIRGTAGRSFDSRSVSLSLFVVTIAGYSLVAAIVFWLRPEFWRFAPATALWLCAAAVSSVLLLGAEILLNRLLVLARTGVWVRKLALSGEWRSFGRGFAYATAVLAAVGEELLMRQVWFSLLAGLGAPVALIVATSAILYGLNHVRSGFDAVASKTLSGLGYSALYWLSGGSLLAPVVCHVGQNILLLALLLRKGRQDA